MQGTLAQIPWYQNIALLERLEDPETRLWYAREAAAHGWSQPILCLQIELEARSTSGVNNINSEEVRALRLSLPSIPEQQEIVRRVESLLALADQIEARFEKAQAQVERLMPSILAKAFRGELVPQDSNDEPASVLIGHIRQTKISTG